MAIATGYASVTRVQPDVVADLKKRKERSDRNVSRMLNAPVRASLLSDIRFSHPYGISVMGGSADG
jgi:hypothetical protein